jgi:hypothetical protein
MGQANKLFTDGEAYERLMGRWSRLVGDRVQRRFGSPTHGGLDSRLLTNFRGNSGHRKSPLPCPLVEKLQERLTLKSFLLATSTPSLGSLTS